MLSILVILSLILHVITFYFLILLSTKYSSMKEVSAKQERLFEEAEQALSAYLIEIKEENERLINQLKNEKETLMQQSDHAKKVNEQKRTVEIDKDILENELPPYLEHLVMQTDTVEISKDSSSLQKETIPLSFQAEVMNLYESGYNVEQIAKKLKKGKTEIELLLKFRQK